MKSFLVLPAIIRLVLASQHVFSVHDDILAYPQYEIIFSDSYVSEAEANTRIHQRPQAHDVAKHIVQDGEHDQSSQNIDLREGGFIPYSSQESQHGAADRDAIYEVLVDVHRQRHLCTIPLLFSPRNQTLNNRSNPSDDGPSRQQAETEESEAELAHATERGWELISGMRGQCIYYISGWWSYSFCYDEGVKQFHALPPNRANQMWPPVEDNGVHSYVLGTVKNGKQQGRSSSRKEVGTGRTAHGNGVEARLRTKGESIYLVQKLGGGTICDLTGRPRKIEVQFHCNSQTQDRIFLIKEVSTCSYLMIIHTPRLCNDIAFLPPQENIPHQITCQLILREDQVDDWKVATRAKAQRLLNAPAVESSEQQQREGGEGRNKEQVITVGDVVLGARATIGPVLTIKPGNIVRPHPVPLQQQQRPPHAQHADAPRAPLDEKETYIGTVAASDDTPLLSQEELNKLPPDISDPEQIEFLKKRAKSLANGRGWRVEIIDTEEGLDFRAVIEMDEADEGGNGGSAAGGDEDGEGGSEELFKEEL